MQTEAILESQPLSSEEAIQLEQQYGAQNYKPLPVVLNRGEGVYLYDPEGQRYYDFLSAYSAVNQGHCHPRIIETVMDQAQKLTLTSRAFYNDQLGKAEKHLCDTFGFEKALFMNSGAEAVETAIKVARRWGYEKKGVAPNEAKILVATNNFHGRTATIISFSTDRSSRKGFGPYSPGFYVVPYDDLDSLEDAMLMENVVGFLVEPMQGEAGVIVPDEGYYKGIRELCDRYNVLWLDDEIQTGLARTGKMLAVDYENVRPDVLILGKALSGGTMPVSAILADDEVMLTIRPGEHGSTFGGNPLGARVAVTALDVLLDEKLAENAYERGQYFRDRMRAIDSRAIRQVRGKGLLNAIVIENDFATTDAYGICKMLAGKGLLAKQTHGNVIRFAPPLVINQEQIQEGCDIIEESILSVTR